MKSLQPEKESYWNQVLQRMIIFQNSMNQFWIKATLVIFKTICIMLIFTSSFFNDYYRMTSFGNQFILFLSSSQFFGAIIFMQIITILLELIAVSFDVMKLLQKYKIFCKFLYMISDILPLFYLLAVDHFLQKGQKGFLIVSLIFLPLILGKFFINQQHNVFRILTPFIIMSYLKINIMYTGLLVMVYGLYKKNKQSQKIFIWKIWIIIKLGFFMITCAYQHPQGSVPLVAFWFLFVVLSIIVIIETNVKGLNNYAYLIDYVRNIKKQDVISQKTKTFYNLNYIFSSMSQQLEEKHNVCFKFMSRNKKQIHKNDILNFLLNYVNYGMSGDPWKILQIKIQMVNDVQQVYNLLDALQCKNIREKVRYKQFKIKIQENFGEEHSMVNYQDITKLQHNIVEFYELINVFLYKCHDFYSYLSRKQIYQGKIQTLFNNAINQKNKMQSVLNNLERYRHSSKQRKIFKELENLINHYDLEQMNEKRESNYSISNLIKMNDHINKDFILVRNDKIQNLSVNLLQKLQKKLNMIIESSFSDIVYKNVQNILKKNVRQFENNTIYIPFYHKQILILLRGKIHMIPTKSNQVRNLFLFDQEQQILPSFLYDHKNDNIISFSSKAYTENPCLQDLINKDQHNFSNKFFSIDLYNKSTFDALRSGNSIKTQFKSLKFNKAQRKIINLKCIQEFKSDSEVYLIISLRSQNPSVQSKKSLQETVRTIENAQNETTFCPIENKYKQQLISVFGQIRHKGLSTQTIKSSILLSLMVIALIVSSIVSLTLLYKQDQQYQQLIILNHELSDQYSRVLYSYYVSYMIDHLEKYPESFESYIPNFDVKQFQIQSMRLLESHLKMVQLIDLKNKYVSYKALMDYQIKFKSYNASYNTNLPLSMVNFIASTQKFVHTLDISYHVQNYKTHMNLEPSFSIQSFIEKIIQQWANLNKMYEIIAFVIIIILFVVIIAMEIYFTIKKNSIYQLSLIIKQDQIQNILTNIEKKRKQLKTLKYMSLVERQQKHFKQQKKPEDHQKSKQFFGQTFFDFMKKISLMIVLMAFFVIILLNHNQFQSNQSQDFKKIYNFLLSIESSSGDIVKLLTEAVYHSVKKDLNSSYVIPKPPDLQAANSYFKDDELPQFFDDFRIHYKKWFYGDLCNYSAKYLKHTKRYAKLDCPTLQSGSLTFGYAVSFERYQHECLYNLKYVRYSQLFTQRSFQKSPVFIDITYMRRILMSATQTLIQEYNLETQRYYQNVQKQVSFIYYAYYSLIFVLMIFSIIFIINRKKQCSNMISFSKSIPQGTLYSIKNTKHLLKINFLETLKSL